MLHRSFTVLLLLVLSNQGSVANRQPGGAAELAARMTGRWRLNVELSPTLADPGPGSRGRRGGVPSLATAGALPQRAGRGVGRPEPGIELPMVTTEEAAAQAALSVIQQVPPELTIEASATELKISEPRGESLFKIDGKNATVQVPGATIKIKSRWDRGSLRQEFSSAMRTLKRAWSIDSNGRLALKQHLESIRGNTKEVEAVFDRQ